MPYTTWGSHDLTVRREDSAVFLYISRISERISKAPSVLQSLVQFLARHNIVSVNIKSRKLSSRFCARGFRELSSHQAVFVKRNRDE